MIVERGFFCMNTSGNVSPLQPFSRMSSREMGYSPTVDKRFWRIPGAGRLLWIIVMAKSFRVWKGESEKRYKTLSVWGQKSSRLQGVRDFTPAPGWIKQAKTRWWGAVLSVIEVTNQHRLQGNQQTLEERLGFNLSKLSSDCHRLTMMWAPSHRNRLKTK